MNFNFLPFLIIFASSVAHAEQKVGRLVVDYPSPISRDIKNEAAVNGIPTSYRQSIRSFETYKAEGVGGLAALNIVILEVAPPLSVTRDGYAGPLNEMKNDPRISEVVHNSKDVTVSGYPAVHTSYKAKFDRKLLVAGDVLYIYDNSTNTSWTVSSSYFWDDGFFSNYSERSNESLSILNSVEIK